VSNGASQSTLFSLQSSLERLVRSLGLEHACTWCALERSVSRSAPVAFGSEPVEHLLSTLQARGVVVPGTHPLAVTRCSLYEPIRWTYGSPWDRLPDVETALFMSIQSVWATSPVQDRLGLWRWLASSESAHYLAYLLRKHQIAPERSASVIETLGSNWTEHSLGRQRYLAWAGVRAAAGALLHSGMDQDQAQAAMIRDMTRRSRSLRQRLQAGNLEDTDFCFVPDQTWRKPIVFDVVMALLQSLGNGYWVHRPGISMRGFSGPTFST
jgi:hypothetical protein